MIKSKKLVYILKNSWFIVLALDSNNLKIFIFSKNHKNWTKIFSKTFRKSHSRFSETKKYVYIFNDFLGGSCRQ